MKKGKITTSLWDAAEYLETEDDMVQYLKAALEENDPILISAVLGDIARAKGMKQIAEKTGLGRTSLYKALSPDGNPEFGTILKVMEALDLHLSAESVKPTKSKTSAKAVPA
jgi:probable addiction module antidote protein